MRRDSTSKRLGSRSRGPLESGVGVRDSMVVDIVDICCGVKRMGDVDEVVGLRHHRRWTWPERKH